LVYKSSEAGMLWRAALFKEQVPKTLIDQEAIDESKIGLVDYIDAKGEKRTMYSMDFIATMTGSIKKNLAWRG